MNKIDSFKITEWDRLNGLGPLVLTYLEQRARLLEGEIMDPRNTETQTALIRGAYSEAQKLRKMLEDAGVKYAN